MLKDVNNVPGERSRGREFPTVAKDRGVIA